MTKARAAALVLRVRLSDEERALLDAAATDARTSVSDFVRRAAIEVAEMAILNRSTITIPAESWGAFEASMNRPAESVPGLVNLFRRKPPWER